MSFFEFGTCEHAVYVRVDGLANMNNSHLFKDLTDTLLQQSHELFFIDLEQCRGMDSTFMGVLVGITLYGQRVNAGEPIKTRVMVLNANDHNQKLLASLGLQDLIQIKQEQIELPLGIELERLEEKEFDPDRRVRMIQEAHEHLAKVNEDNARVFAPFLQNLAAELATRETG